MSIRRAFASIACALLALTVAGCGAPAARVEAPLARVEAPVAPPLLRGAIELPEGASGALVVTWFTPDELADRERALANLIVGVERAIVLPSNAASIPFELPVPR